MSADLGALQPVFDLCASQNRGVHIAAPMVRYSKLPFRLLCRAWGCDVAYTPMIVADSFVAADKARFMGFSTNTADRPLIAQFAASDACVMERAAALIATHCDAVDVNCGCPQKWAMADGIGAALLADVELVRDMVRRVRAGGDLPISIKIRTSSDLRKTVDLCRAVEAAGVAFVTVHGRTHRQRSSEPVDLAAIKLVKESVAVPVIANGDVFSLTDARRIVAETGCDGTMAARGLLANPALYDARGFEQPPIECVGQFMRLGVQLGFDFDTVHHHLQWMLTCHLSSADRKEFNGLNSMGGVYDFFERRGATL